MSAAAITREIRRRRPHLLIACVVAGLALAPVGVGPVLCSAAVAATVGAYGFGRGGAALAIALVLGAAVFASWRMESIDRPASAARPGSHIEATATLLDRPRTGLFGSSAPMQIETGPARGLRIL